MQGRELLSGMCFTGIAELGLFTTLKYINCILALDVKNRSAFQKDVKSQDGRKCCENLQKAIF